MSASICLYLQIELVALGSLSPLIPVDSAVDLDVAGPAAPKPNTPPKPLISLLCMNTHQKQELVSELNILLRVRHQVAAIL